jgi:hypothetical protein
MLDAEYGKRVVEFAVQEETVIRAERRAPERKYH